MNKTVLILLLFTIIPFAFESGANTSEYRLFTNLKEKSIFARIIEYDHGENRVLLELTNRKKSWINVSSLSKEDQDYIRLINTTSGSDKTTPIKIAPLTEEKLTEIGEQYISFIESKTEATSLFLTPDNLMTSLLPSLNKRYKIGGIWVDDIDDEECFIRLEVNQSAHIELPNPRGLEHYYSTYEYFIYLMVTHSGKVKYDSCLCLHPLEITKRCLLFLDTHFDEYVEYQKRGSEMFRNAEDEEAFKQIAEDVEIMYRTLERQGISLYGFLLESSPSDFQRTKDKIIRWILKNGEKWDVSEPEVFVPKPMFKSIKIQLLHLR